MQPLSFSRLAFTAALVLFFAGTRLDAKYIPVDDTDTNWIVYSTDSGWNIGNTCTGCLVKLDNTKVFNGTWHDVIAGQDGPNDASFEFVFMGIGVRVIYTAVESVDRLAAFTNNVNLKYSINNIPRNDVILDGAPIANQTTYVYNKTLFDVVGLPNAQHTLKVELRKPSLLLLDYLMYDDGSTDSIPGPTSDVATRPSATSTASTSSIPGDSNSTTRTNPVMIIGWVVAAVVILVLIGVLVWCFLERRRKRRASRTITLLGSEDPPLPQSLPSSVRPMSTATITPFGLTLNPQPNPQPSSSNHAATHLISVMDSKSSRVPPQERTIHVPSNSLTSSTVPPDPPGIQNLSDLPSVPVAHQGSGVDTNRRHRIPQSSRQGPTTDTAPPGLSHTNLTATSVPALTPNEPVELGRISRQLSRNTLPPYSPGGFLSEENPPPMPVR